MTDTATPATVTGITRADKIYNAATALFVAIDAEPIPLEVKQRLAPLVRALANHALRATGNHGSASADKPAAADPGSAERDLLGQAEKALHSLALWLVTVSPKLSEPFTDQPQDSSWSLTIGPEARRAHALASQIRMHLGSAEKENQGD